MAKNVRLTGSQKDVGVSDQEVWLAIRYLDPDDSAQFGNNLAVIITMVAVLLIVGAACALLYFRGL